MICEEERNENLEFPSQVNPPSCCSCNFSSCGHCRISSIPFVLQISAHSLPLLCSALSFHCRRLSRSITPINSSSSVPPHSSSLFSPLIEANTQTHSRPQFPSLSLFLPALIPHVLGPTFFPLSDYLRGWASPSLSLSHSHSNVMSLSLGSFVSFWV